ncbi:hypothetical protein B0H14DRAFT_2558067 [Mycena olivaceomarginata]|nr:hypothetical protein B0H14DRAFT_2558067 [Mycena olivaceomarginata]
MTAGANCPPTALTLPQPLRMTSASRMQSSAFGPGARQFGSIWIVQLEDQKGLLDTGIRQVVAAHGAFQVRSLLAGRVGKLGSRVNLADLFPLVPAPIIQTYPYLQHGS